MAFLQMILSTLYTYLHRSDQLLCSFRTTPLQLDFLLNKALVRNQFLETLPYPFSSTLLRHLQSCKILSDARQ